MTFSSAYGRCCGARGSKIIEYDLNTAEMPEMKKSAVGVAEQTAKAKYVQSLSLHLNLNFEINR